jgi:hypothetical protein
MENLPINREKVALNRWKECRAAFFLLLIAHGPAFNPATSRLHASLRARDGHQTSNAAVSVGFVAAQFYAEGRFQGLEATKF